MYMCYIYDKVGFAEANRSFQVSKDQISFIVGSTNAKLSPIMTYMHTYIALASAKCIAFSHLQLKYGKDRQVNKYE